MTYMRITTRLLNDSVINNLFANRSKLNTLQEELATGKRVSKPSDDPNAAISILSSQLSSNQIDRYTDNIDNANSELDMADKAILSAVDAVHRAKDLTTQASNATSGSSQIDAIKAEIDQLVLQIKDIANTKIGSTYIFGGVVTETPPYSLAANGDIVYNGTPSTGNYQRKTEISENITIDVNVPGDSVFGQYIAADPTQQSGIIGTLKTLSQDLSASPPNYDNIRSRLDTIDKDLNTLLNNQASIGGTMSRLDMTKKKLQEDDITYSKVREEAEGIDLAKTISDVSYQQTALQVSLQVSAKSIQRSLMDYV